MTTSLPDSHQDSAVLETERPQIQPPRLYRVLLLNDDYTPMEFVVQVLERFFAMPRERAITIMLKVHHEGRGLCGIYPHDIAATKVGQVNAFALQHQHPLVCFMEEEKP
ncbi:MAG: ATP-dependent Clp protease adapter ClpS [Zoogloeaceae bacterium]|nr:ATP-dependent Clp protease adapter ClpS [Zoogloeaceae bacterium]